MKRIATGHELFSLYLATPQTTALVRHHRGSPLMIASAFFIFIGLAAVMSALRI